MSLYDDLLAGKTALSVVGLGYVGMPLAVAFSKHVRVIGYDVNARTIDLYKTGIDPTSEVGDEAIRACSVEFTSNSQRLEEARYHIVAVPTPINLDKTPNLAPVRDAARIVGQHLQKGSIVVFESTVYPGVTENICIPTLEKESGLECGPDFKVGYSPERINPGDKVHTLATIKKVVSGIDDETVAEIAAVYDLVVEAGTHSVSSIKTAEAIKVAENSQRDINIAFMNELAMVFDRMGIDSNEVVDGMNTKWNALRFRPGLVGGHCIGVDPYYFIYEAEKLGYHSQIILAGRKVNDGMGGFVADAAVREMVRNGLAPARAHVVILGLTFKENCPDCRNSKVGDIIDRLREYGIEPAVIDPYASASDALNGYGVNLSTSAEQEGTADCIIVAVSHREFKEGGLSIIQALFAQGNVSNRVLVDVKGIYNERDVEQAGYSYWRL